MDHVYSVSNANPALDESHCYFGQNVRTFDTFPYIVVVVVVVAVAVAVAAAVVVVVVVVMILFVNGTGSKNSRHPLILYYYYT
jgi:hypothetical protein